MIAFKRYVLPNGLKLLVNEDFSTPFVALSLQYNVGSRNESPHRTGLAHLFEHLMFSGSRHVEDFDEWVQRAGGDNNAFTNRDLTNFHMTLPAVNLDTALWLEADRMEALLLDEESVEIQRKVVIEEFKETCLNEPFGDVEHHLLRLNYKRHPYRWPTIGLRPSHVAKASMQELLQFYRQHYRPDNAILALSGAISAEAAFRKTLRFFGHIPNPETESSTSRNAEGNGRIQTAEPRQRKARHLDIKGPVGVDALYLSYPICGRLEADYYPLDLLSDVLSMGMSSRLYKRLIRGEELATHVDCYLTESLDPGLLIIEAKARPGINLEAIKAAIESEIEVLRQTPISQLELEKIKNAVQADITVSEIGISNRCIDLCYYESLGDAALINTEWDRYENLVAEDLRKAAEQYLRPERQNVLNYHDLKEEFSNDQAMISA